MMNRLRLAVSPRCQRSVATLLTQSSSARSTLSNTTIRHFASKRLIINAVGSDRLGIVSDMTKYVTDSGGNVGASQAAKLGSHFSLMMLIDVPEENVDELVTKLTGMTDMNASIHDANDDNIPTPKIAFTGKFTLRGADHPGIVHKVTTILSQNGLSVDKMETSAEIAPYGGAMLFKMSGIANAAEPLASGFDPEKIDEQLSDLGNQLNCDISLKEVKE